MKEGPLFKLTITKGGQQTTQYKKIHDALPVFCTDKGFRYIDDIICTNEELAESAFLPTYPSASQWSKSYQVHVVVVDEMAPMDTTTDLCPVKTVVHNKT